MDIRDYIRMLKRGWVWITLAVVLSAGLTALYLSVTPKQYQSTTVLMLRVKDPQSISDLEQGAALASRTVVTFAQIIDSPAVLEQVRTSTGTALTVNELASRVTATARPSTPLIDITVSGPNSAEVAEISNSTAQAATVLLPDLQGTGTDLMSVTQILPALEPTSAVSPDVSRTMTIGLMLGLIVGLAGTIAAQALDTRIRRPDDLRRLSAVPLLTVVPRTRGGETALLEAHLDSDPAAKAFRVLRTNLLFSDTATHRSLLFTSVSDSADVAVVPANLAWSLAAAGHSVVLVDLDLRPTRPFEGVGVDSEPGIAEVLAGSARIQDTARPTQHANLHVVRSGNVEPHLTETLGGPAIKAALEWLRSTYDFVVLRAPSVLAYSDAAVLSTVVGGTVLAVSAGRTRAVDLESALTVLSNVGVTPVGLVLTRVARSALTQGPRGELKERFRATRNQRRRFDWDRDLVASPGTTSDKPTSEATL